MSIACKRTENKNFQNYKKIAINKFHGCATAQKPLLIILCINIYIYIYIYIYI